MRMWSIPGASASGIPYSMAKIAKTCIKSKFLRKKMTNSLFFSCFWATTLNLS